MDGSKYDSSIAASLLRNEDGLDFEHIRNIEFLVAAFCSIISFIAYFITYLKQDERVFRAASRTFLFIMFLGAQLSWISLALNASLDFYPDLDMCFAIFTTEMIGFAIVFGCLIMKSLRLVQFLKSQHKLPKYTDYFLLKLLFGFISFIACICAVAYILPLVEPPSFVVYTQYTIQDDNFMRKCSMGSLAQIKIIVQVVCGLVGMVICYSTSDIPAPFEEGVWITRAVYNYVGAIIGFVVYTVISPDPSLSVRILGQSGNVIGAQLIAILLMLVPKLFVKKQIGYSKSLKMPRISGSQITIITPEPAYIQSKPIMSTSVPQ